MINNDNESSTPTVNSTEQMASTIVQDEKPIETTTQQEDDEFIRITAAHQILTEAQKSDEEKNYPAALHLYRICVDLLLEELMFTEGTEQSRVYLREKCTAIMDHIDLLKTKLEPIPPSDPPAAISNANENESTSTLPTDQLESLHLS